MAGLWLVMAGLWQVMAGLWQVMAGLWQVMAGLWQVMAAYGKLWLVNCRLTTSPGTCIDLSELNDLSAFNNNKLFRRHCTNVLDIFGKCGEMNACLFYLR